MYIKVYAYTQTYKIRISPHFTSFCWGTWIEKGTTFFIFIASFFILNTRFAPFTLLVPIAPTVSFVPQQRHPTQLEFLHNQRFQQKKIKNPCEARSALFCIRYGAYCLHAVRSILFCIRQNKFVASPVLRRIVCTRKNKPLLVRQRREKIFPLGKTPLGREGEIAPTENTKCEKKGGKLLRHKHF